MQIKEFSIALDMKRTLSFPPFEVVEGDTGNVLHVALTNDGAAVDLAACSVCIVFASSAGFAIQDLTSGVVLGEMPGTFSISLYPDSYGAGDVRADVQVYSGADNETLITSKRFTFRCIKGLMQPDIIRASSAYPPLMQATSDAREATAAALAAAELALSKVQSDWTETDSTDAAYVRNKPASFTPSAHAAAHRTGGADAITPASIGAMAAAAHPAPAAHAATHSESGTDAVTPAAIGAIPASQKGAASGVATLDAGGKVEANQTSAAIFALTASVTLGSAHAGSFLYLNSSAPLTVTIPADASVLFPTGTEIELCRWNTGTVTLAGEAGVSIRSADGMKAIAVRYGVVALKKTGGNTWLLAGALG